MPMSKTMIAGLLAAILIGGVSGLILMVVDGFRRLLATDRDWTLAPRFQYATTEPDNVDPLGYGT